MLLCPIRGFAVDAPSGHVEFVQSVYNSVVLLYTQSEDGGMKMLCTATAYKKTAAGYRLVSAAHCVAGDNDVQQKAAKYFVTTDSNGSKTFISAKLIQAGDKNVGDDFSIFEISNAVQLSVTPLGDSDSLVLGEPVIDVSSPLGFGKIYFQGYVGMILLDRPPLDAGEVSWTDVMLVEIGGGPGSSGSAIVSESQHAIIGFLVGSTGAPIGVIALPVSKFKAFESRVDQGTYKKTHKDQ